MSGYNELETREEAQEETGWKLLFLSWNVIFLLIFELSLLRVHFTEEL